jgi:undecaprenyl diphosphate synthase
MASRAHLSTPAPEPLTTRAPEHPITSDPRWQDPEPAEPVGDAERSPGRDRFHVAINMDGNGRWALLRGRPREEGHIAGSAAVRRTVESAPKLGITTLTLYAFSSDNWRRPRGEVDNLMFLLQNHLDTECDHMTDTGVRFSVIGRRDRIPDSLRRSIAHVEQSTSDGTALHLRVAIDYSARGALLAAAARIAKGVAPTREAFERSMFEAINAPIGTRDVDLLIRTGGEQRLSDFLLWESAYAELYFTNVLWPDFKEADLAAAVQDFAGRDRRYGGVLTSEAAPQTVLRDGSAPLR